MKKNTIGITSATIRGLNDRVYYLTEKCFWTWNIRFENHPYVFNNPILYMGKIEYEATETYLTIKHFFEVAHISDGDRVAIIYDNDGIVAIGKDGKDCWINMKSGTPRIGTFNELALSFDSLVVACN